ncbi:MAG: hypothetical protein WC758_07760 [Candidatus Woesearchaeota archaeon]
MSKFLYPLVFGQTVQNLFSITPQSALTSTSIGDKLIGFLTGLIPFNFGDVMSYVSMFIGTAILLLLGMFVYDKLPRVIQGNNKFQKLGVILAVGSIALYLLLLVTKMGAVASVTSGLLIGTAVNYAIVTLAVVMIAKTKLGSKMIVI